MWEGECGGEGSKRGGKLKESGERDGGEGSKRGSKSRE